MKTLKIFLFLFFISFVNLFSQNIRTDQIIQLQNYTAPNFSIKFGVSVNLYTNYSILLPSSYPTAVNQTLIVYSVDTINKIFVLGWGNTLNIQNCNNITTIQQFNSDQNNLNLDLINYSIFRISSNTDIDITGINSSQACEGKRIILVNIGNSEIKIKKENSNSSSNNRILSQHNDYELDKNDSIELIYDSVSNRWRILGGHDD